MADSGADENLESVLTDWAKERGRVAVCVVTTAKTSLQESHVLELWAKLNRKYDKADLIIHSYGGDANSAFQIVELLRLHMTDAKSGLTGVVPYRAASAATLMCLACDELMLDELARLGPLDAQIYESAKGGGYRRVSALNPQEAVKQLNELAIISLLATKSALTQDGVLPGEAYEIATELVTGLFSKLYEQISPERLAEYSRLLSVAREYATCLLKRHSKLSPADQAALVDKLVKGYPWHGYYIDSQEAKEMKLKVVEVPSNLEVVSAKLIREVVRADSGVVVIDPFVPKTITQTTTLEKPRAASKARKKQRAPATKRRLQGASAGGTGNGKQR